MWPVPVAANLFAAFFFSFRTNDLETVRRWGQAWLRQGEDLYASLSWGCDYPPHASVVLAPIALLSLPAAAIVWATLNLGFAVAAPWLAARLVRRDVPKQVLLLFTTTFLCWSATRTLVQFTLVAVLLGLASGVVGEKRSGRGGILLGLALIKPQIAVPFVLWTAFRRRWGVLTVAAATVAVLTAVYCLRVGVGPLDVTTGYLRVLQSYYAGPAAMVGASDLRGLFRAIMEPATADLLASGSAIVLLALTCAVGFRAMKLEARAAGMLALGSVWSLLTFRQLSYGFVLLLPVSAYLLLSDARNAARWRHRWFWMLQALLIVDVPTVLRRVEAAGYSAGPATGLLVHFDRLLLLSLFTVLCALEVSAPTAPDRVAQSPAGR